MNRDVPATRLTISRCSGGTLELDGLGLAVEFFSRDPSSTGERSFDSHVLATARDTVDASDLSAINGSMRARSARVHWAPLMDRPLRWLSDIDPALDLVEADDREWKDAEGERLLRAALAAIIAPYRGPAVATKMLHLKRPRLFPVLDAFVCEMMGRRIPDSSPQERARVASDLAIELREQGRRNLAQLKAIQAQLQQRGIERSLVRILDGILWFAHPGASVQGVSKVIGCRLD
jgi:hypothetical protein